MSNERDALHQLIFNVIERRGNVVSISPSWVATEALTEIDPERISPELAYRAAHLQLRQMARDHCRGKWERDDAEIEEQHEMFPDLQRRYPAARSAKQQEPEYILLDHLSERDVEYNVNRLRSEADAKARHADALEAWGQHRWAA